MNFLQIQSLITGIPYAPPAKQSDVGGGLRRAGLPPSGLRVEGLPPAIGNKRYRREIIPGYEDGSRWHKRRRKTKKHKDDSVNRAFDLLVNNHRGKRKRFERDRKEELKLVGRKIEDILPQLAAGKRKSGRSREVLKTPAPKQREKDVPMSTGLPDPYSTGVPDRKRRKVDTAPMTPLASRLPDTGTGTPLPTTPLGMTPMGDTRTPIPSTPLGMTPIAERMAREAGTGTPLPSTPLGMTPMGDTRTPIPSTPLGMTPIAERMAREAMPALEAEPAERETVDLTQMDDVPEPQSGVADAGAEQIMPHLMRRQRETVDLTQDEPMQDMPALEAEPAERETVDLTQMEDVPEPQSGVADAGAEKIMPHLMRRQRETVDLTQDEPMQDVPPAAEGMEVETPEETGVKRIGPPVPGREFKSRVVKSKYTTGRKAGAKAARRQAREATLQRGRTDVSVNRHGLSEEHKSDWDKAVKKFGITKAVPADVEMATPPEAAAEPVRSKKGRKAGLGPAARNQSRKEQRAETLSALRAVPAPTGPQLSTAERNKIHKQIDDAKRAHLYKKVNIVAAKRDIDRQLAGAAKRNTQDTIVRQMAAAKKAFQQKMDNIKATTTSINKDLVKGQIAEAKKAFKQKTANIRAATRDINRQLGRKMKLGEETKAEHLRRVRLEKRGAQAALMQRMGENLGYTDLGLTPFAPKTKAKKRQVAQKPKPLSQPPLVRPARSGRKPGRIALPPLPESPKRRRTLQAASSSQSAPEPKKPRKLERASSSKFEAHKKKSPPKKKSPKKSPKKRAKVVYRDRVVRGPGGGGRASDMRVAPTQQVTVAGGKGSADLSGLVAKIDKLLKEQGEKKAKTAQKKVFTAAKKEYRAYRKKAVADIKARNKLIKKKELSRIRRLPQAQRAGERTKLKKILKERLDSVTKKLPSKIQTPGQLREIMRK